MSEPELYEPPTKSPTVKVKKSFKASIQSGNQLDYYEKGVVDPDVYTRSSLKKSLNS